MKSHSGLQYIAEVMNLQREQVEGRVTFEVLAGLDMKIEGFR